MIQAIALIILSGITMVVIAIICLTRSLEIIIRGAFLPLGIAALAEDGWRGAGGRYFKRLFALMLQASLILFISLAISFIRDSMLKNMIDGLYGSTTGTVMESFGSFGVAILAPLISTLFILAVTVAGIAAMFKSIQMANDIVGA